MPVAFPGLQPSERRFSPPRWPTSGVQSRSGLSSVRLWGSRPGNAELDLLFRNITDVATSDILQAYHSAKGNVIDLTLPTIIFQGASITLRSWLDTSATGAGIKWYFAPDSPPQVTSVAPNTSDVQVRLTGELRLP